MNMKKPNDGRADIRPTIENTWMEDGKQLERLMARMRTVLRETSEAADLCQTGDPWPGSEYDAADTLRWGQLAPLLSTANQLCQAQEALVAQLRAAREEAVSLQRALREARAEAKTDPLTTLANRQGFLERLSSIMRSGELAEGEHCLLMLDIDNFKRINDTHGHLFGDEVIRSVARILKQTTKGKDMAARFGGEEFVVLLPHTSLQGAAAVAQSIRQGMERGGLRGPEREAADGPLTVSLGVTPLLPGDNIERAVARADDALYQAKAAGRNCVRINTAGGGLRPGVTAITMPGRTP